MTRTRKHLVGILALAAVAQAATPAFAQFGGLKLPAVPAKPATPAANAAAVPSIDQFLVTTEQARELTRRASVLLLKAVANHEDWVKIDEEQKAADAVTDPKEREAALSKVQADANAQLASVDFDAKAKEMEGHISEEQRKELAAAVFNLALGILKDKDVVLQGTAITESTVKNPILLATQGPKLIKVKDAVGAIGGQMGNLGKIAVGLPKLMSAAKIQALPTSSADKPQAVDLP